MSQRFVVIAGGCLLIGVGVVIGKSSIAPQNGVDRRGNSAATDPTFNDRGFERREFENRDAVSVGPPGGRIRFPLANTNKVAERPVPHGDINHATPTPQPPDSPFGQIAQSGGPPSHGGPFDKSRTQPGQLPPQQNASPIHDDRRIATPRALRGRHPQSVRDIIREEMPNASDAIVDEIAKSLKGQPPHAVRNILEIQRNTGSLLSIDPANPKKPAATTPRRDEPRLQIQAPLIRRPACVPGIGDRTIEIPHQLRQALKVLRERQDDILRRIAVECQAAADQTRLRFKDDEQKKRRTGRIKFEIRLGFSDDGRKRKKGNGPSSIDNTGFLANELQCLRDVAERIRIIHEAARIVSETQSSSRPISHATDPATDLNGADVNNARSPNVSRMIDFQGRAKSRSRNKISSLSPAPSGERRVDYRKYFMSPKAREIERNLGIDSETEQPNPGARENERRAELSETVQQFLIALGEEICERVGIVGDR